MTTRAAGPQASATVLPDDCNCPEDCRHDHENE